MPLRKFALPSIGVLAYIAFAIPKALKFRVICKVKNPLNKRLFILFNPLQLE
jgi:hypothetical protein